MKLASAAVVLLVAASAIAAPPARPRGADAAASIAVAQAQLDGGNAEVADAIVASLLADEVIAPADRAEAGRIAGLARLQLGRRADAEVAFLVFLRLEPDAHLDPALVAPESVLFFEEVRARHAAELDALRRPPPRERWFVLNLLPPLGQFQNGDRGKGWTLAALEVVLAVANVATYVALKDMCDASSCGEDPSTARALRTVNLVSGGALVVVVAYGIYDGIAGYREESSRQRADVMLAPVPGGAIVGARLTW